MKIVKNNPFGQESLTQTLPSDLAERARLATAQQDGDNPEAVNSGQYNSEQSEANLSENNSHKKKTKVYEPRPLTPQDPIYEEVMSQVGSRPVKPRYWFEEFGDFWSCSCGHINKGETCVGCGLSRDLLRSIFILHKPANSKSNLSSRIKKEKEQIEKEAAYIEAVNERVSSNTSTDLDHIKPIEEFGDDVDVTWGKAEPDTSSEDNSKLNNEADSLVYTNLDDDLPAPSSDNNKLMKLPSPPRIPGNKIAIVIIIIALIAAIIGGIAFYKNVAGPSHAYNEAIETMESGDYETAITQFQELGNYKNSTDMIAKCYIGIGTNQMESGDYDDALETFATAQSYNSTDEATNLIRECYIQIGDKYYSESKLTKALKTYRKAQEINKTEDVREKIRLCLVGIGDKRFADNDYDKAFENYEKAQKIKETDEVKDKINDVKYAYVKRKMKSRSDTVESYLNDLMDANYPGIQSLYDEYYAWHISIIANNSASDTKTKQKSFSKFDTVYFHTKVTGGEPNEKIKLYYTITWPDGTRDQQILGDEWKTDSNITTQFVYPMPMFGLSGNMTFTVYDAQSNEKLDSCTVKLTD